MVSLMLLCHCSVIAHLNLRATTRAFVGFHIKFPDEETANFLCHNQWIKPTLERLHYPCNKCTVKFEESKVLLVISSRWSWTYDLGPSFLFASEYKDDKGNINGTVDVHIGN